MKTPICSYVFERKNDMSTPEMPGSQPASLKGSWKYLALEKLPRIDTGTLFKDAYSQLSRSGCSGFLLTDKGEVQGYVKADDLAAAVVTRARGDGQKLREYSAAQIGSLINNFALTLVPVIAAPAGATEPDLYAADETVFRITEADGSTGWYLNHETVRDAATRRTVFICTNGHRNPDSDHGTCYSCPFPIVSTETE
jgi:hypothetical protein